MLYVFDMGNVVIKGIDVLKPTVDLLGLDEEEFMRDYRFYDHPLMDGALTCDDYYKHLEHVFNVKVSGKPFSDLFKPFFNQPMVDVIDYLHSKGRRVVCASNTFKPHWDVIEKLGFDKVFDKCYLSHEIGMTKPSKAFFNYILRCENAEPSDVFFTDDYKENIDAASSMGIKTLWYVKGYDDSKLMKVFSQAE